MNEDALQAMQAKLTVLEGSYAELLVKYDILADRLEKVDPRGDSKTITETKITEHLGDMSIEAMIQVAKSFEQNYDSDSVRNLHGKDKKEYEFKKKQYELIKERLADLGQDFKTIVNSSTEVKKLVQKLKEHNAKYDESWNDDQKKSFKAEHLSIMDELRKAQGDSED